jgi:hypothetical protein
MGSNANDACVASGYQYAEVVGRTNHPGPEGSVSPLLILGVFAVCVVGVDWIKSGIDPLMRVVMAAAGLRTFLVLAWQCVAESWDHIVSNWSTEYAASIEAAANRSSHDPLKVVSFMRRPVA